MKSRARDPRFAGQPARLSYILIGVLLAPPVATAADRFWREITVPRASEAAASFRTPPPESGPVLWWGFDGPVDEAVIERDLDRIKAMGFTSVMIEAGYGMSSPYLSPGWFELVKLAVKHAKRRNLRVWVEDEGKYPSGFAGGKFSAERPELRMQALVVAERIAATSGETVTRKLAPETAGVLAVNLADNTSTPVETPGGELRWTVPPGKWELRVVEHQFRSSPTRAVNNPTRGKDTTNSLGDYLNPQATRQFLAWTHEQYKKYVGGEFGRTFMGFMGDEPDYTISGIPWTPALAGEFEKRKGYDVQPYLASFFAPKLSVEAQRAKADYWDVWSDLFSENFFKIQADWCAANGLQYKVHLNHEDQFMDLVRSEGDYFKDMRYVQVPGIDTIWNQIWFDKVADFPKLASSAAHLFGRPRAFSESFAAYRIRPNVAQAKWVIDYQLVRGINWIQVMFYPASSGAERADPGFMGAAEFPAVARYVARASCLLSLGRPAAQIGLYLPTTSMWLGDEAANRSTWRLVQQLLEAQRDFDFVDEQALASVMTLDKDVFRTVSGNEYSAILIPDASVISQTSLERLKSFAQAGGHVVFTGRKPALVNNPTFLKAAAAGDFGWAASAYTLPTDVSLDSPASEVKYVHRHWRDAELYFFFNESDRKLSRQALLAGRGEAEIWNAATGAIAPYSGAQTELGGVRVRLDLGPYESRFILLRGR